MLFSCVALLLHFKILCRLVERYYFIFPLEFPARYDPIVFSYNKIIERVFFKYL